MGDLVSNKPLDIGEDVSVQMPMKTVASLIGLVAIGTWAYFGVIETQNTHNTRLKLMEADLEKNTEFRIKWPRGEMGKLPADGQQDMLIEFMAAQIEAMQEEMEGMMSNTVNIKRAQQDIEKLILDTEKLEDKVRANGSH